MKIAQSETACDHFHFVVESITGPSLRDRIVAYMQEYPRKPDWSIAEIAHGMGLEKSTVSARRHELLDLFILERGEKRHCSITGVKVETVRIKRNAQVDAFKELAREMGGS